MAKIKKSFYNDYNGDFSKVVFDVLASFIYDGAKIIKKA